VRGALVLVVLVLVLPLRAAAQTYNDRLCPATVAPIRAYLGLAQAGAVPPERALAAIDAVLDALASCESENRDAKKRERVNYTHVRESDWHIRRALVNGQRNHNAEARKDLEAALALANVVVEFEERAPITPAAHLLPMASATPVPTIHDAGHSEFYLPAKQLSERASALLTVLSAPKEP